MRRLRNSDSGDDTEQTGISYKKLPQRKNDPPNTLCSYLIILNIWQSNRALWNMSRFCSLQM